MDVLHRLQYEGNKTVDRLTTRVLGTVLYSLHISLLQAFFFNQEQSAEGF